MKAVRRLNGIHWAWVHAKISLGAWSIVFMIITPPPVANALGSLIVVTIAVATVVGTATSVIGLVMSARCDADPLVSKRIITGLGIERMGLWVALIGGVFAYGLTQAILALGTDGTSRVHLVVLMYAFGGFIIGRLVTVNHQLRKELARAKVVEQV